MTQSYVLSEAAAADLREIVRYTLANWGEEPCRAYVAALARTSQELATGQGVFKSMETLLAGLRVAKSGKHYVFCVPQQGRPALILAILHERMDLISRLNGRLDL